MTKRTLRRYIMEQRREQWKNRLFQWKQHDTMMALACHLTK